MTQAETIALIVCITVVVLAYLGLEALRALSRREQPEERSLWYRLFGYEPFSDKEG